MLFSIASQKTIHEYNTLKQSKQEININKTTKQMDEYVYDKKNGLKNAGIIGGSILVDILIADFIKNDKLIKKSSKLLKWAVALATLGLNIYAGKVIHDAEKHKQAVLNDPQKKLELYHKNGINAVA